MVEMFLPVLETGRGCSEAVTVTGSNLISFCCPAEIIEKRIQKIRNADFIMHGFWLACKDVQQMFPTCHFVVI